MLLFKRLILIISLIIFIFVPKKSFCISPESTDFKEGLHSTSKIDNTKFTNSPKPLATKYNDSVAITGDSYAGYLCQFEGRKDIYMEKYMFPGQTVIQNKDLMIQAATSKCPILIISVGVNDHAKLTPPYIFEATLREIIYNALPNKKLIILHSFLDYPASTNINTNYKISYYDGAIKRIADDFEIIHYIDMNECANEQYFSSDYIHYEKEFYDVLYKKIVDLINSIDF